MNHPHLFSPVTVGGRVLRNRVVHPPHGHVVSSLWGSESDASGHIAYWAARSEAGWVDGVSAHVRNNLPAGFDPTGVGATVNGHFRESWFVDRVGRLADTLHASETVLTVQMIMQGGMPNAPSSVLSGPTINAVPHALTLHEIDQFVEEYRFGASQVREAGADGVELHLNHDDLLEWFASPLTNRRTDEYGGSLENRLRFPTRILRAVRAELAPGSIVGVRLNLREEEPGGYDVHGAADIARHLDSLGLVDYISCTVGSPWGNPSYVQSHHHRPAQWAALARTVKEAVGVPVVYTGRVTSPQVAERLLAEGHVDLVGMARAAIADADMLVKAREGRDAEIRPCVGGNECINRRLVEGTPFSCAVNPDAGRERTLPLPAPTRIRDVLVVGGGPAGCEAAARAAEQGHRVTLWEASEHLGGQLRIAARAPRHEEYADYLAWQEDRLGRVGVQVRTGLRADADLVAAHGADTVVVATGATPRSPGIPGEDLPHVHQSVEVLDGTCTPAGHVVVIAQDDHLPPLAVADHLAGSGARVTLVHGTTAPAPLLSRYTVGSALGRLDDQDVTVRTDEQVVEITGDSVLLRNVYSGKVRALDGVDAVVLSCGGVPRAELHEELRARGVEAHLIGDAFAPRRLVWATQQAASLVRGW